MGVFHTSSFLIIYDNRSAVQIVHNYVFQERTKHIEMDYHFVCHPSALSRGTLRLCLIVSIVVCMVVLLCASSTT
jgi:hypothetical protein